MNLGIFGGFTPNFPEIWRRGQGGEFSKVLGTHWGREKVFKCFGDILGTGIVRFLGNFGDEIPTDL